eukprot:598671-Prymnesium_polylepis.1
MRCSARAAGTRSPRAGGGGLRAAAHEAGRARYTLEHRLPAPRPCRRACLPTPPRSTRTEANWLRGTK